MGSDAKEFVAAPRPDRAPRNMKQVPIWRGVGQGVRVCHQIKITVVELGVAAASLRIDSEVPGSGDLTLKVGETVFLEGTTSIRVEEIAASAAKIWISGPLAISVQAEEKYQASAADHWENDPA